MTDWGGRGPQIGKVCLRDEGSHDEVRCSAPRRIVRYARGPC